MQLHKSTVLVMLMDVIMPAIVGILTFMSMAIFMNVLRLICQAGGCKNANNCWYSKIYERAEVHECFKIDLVAYAINNMSRLKNILQTFKLYNFIKVLSLSC